MSTEPSASPAAADPGRFAFTEDYPTVTTVSTETDAGVPGNWTVTFNFYGARGRVDLYLLRKPDEE